MTVEHLDIRGWIKDNEHDIFSDEEEPKYIPSPVVEDYLEEIKAKMVDFKQNVIEAFKECCNHRSNACDNNCSSCGAYKSFVKKINIQ